MDFLIKILDTIKDFSPLGVAALSILALVYIQKGNKAVNKIKDNHLHEVVGILISVKESLDRIETHLGKSIEEVRDDVKIIKERTK